MPFMRRNERKAADRLNKLEAAKVQMTLGPYFFADVAGTASQFLLLPYFNTTTAVSLSAREVTMVKAGRIIGMAMVADTDVTAGTIVGRASIAGVATAFAAGICALSTTQPVSCSTFVEYEDGLAFTAGQKIGMNVNTTGMTPTTLNLTAWLTVALDP